MSKYPTLAEKCFVVVSLFFSTSALIPVLLDSQESSTTASDPYSPILFLGIYAITGLLIAQQWQSFVQVARKNIWIWLIVAIAIASVYWTVASDITSRRSILLLGTSLFGTYMAMRFTLREQLHLLAIALGLVAVLSLIFAIALPFYGVMSIQEGGVHEGAWRGVMTHKNVFGRVMVLSNLVFLFVALGKPISPTSKQSWQWLAWLCYGLSIALIILSTSKTALISTIVLTVVLLLYRTWRLSYSQLIPLTIVIVLVLGNAAILVFDNINAISGAIGRDLTLTGRTDIWAVMLDKLAERPLIGYGFNAFWRDWNSPVTAEVWRILAWECPYGHNGFMDLLVELGIPALVIFMISYIIAILRGVKLLQSTRNIEGIWHLMFLTFILIYNISESSLLATNSIFWILYVSTVFSLAAKSQPSPVYQFVTALSEDERLELEVSRDWDLRN
ncbi:O-antigen ligase [Calothrix sp. UHCC 0171]|uniref:O-antigen ligase family protein n=1 Tax=Calothrix sp. UHCC 0171 TaxID=3110245 RepID=UPI002B1EEFF9|nr:O-antigen ligase [Calothrix sp. UHCC 0171]MEA5570616.1 O-antigen ligase [Calothrix sp. UHCC 0171]